MISGISCVTFTSASSLFMVINEGVEMMLLLPSLRSAWISAAKLTPLFTTRPIATVAPVPTVELLMVGVPTTPGTAVVVVVEVPWVKPKAAAARSTMLVPVPGRLMMPAGYGAVALPEEQPLHAEVRALVDVDFDDDGFDLNLRAADIELVDHAHQGLHDFGRRGDDQRVGRRRPPRS